MQYLKYASKPRRLHLLYVLGMYPHSMRLPPVFVFQPWLLPKRQSGHSLRQPGLMCKQRVA